MSELKLCLINVQSFINISQRIKLSNFLSSISVDILFITETWLYNDIICHEVFPFNDFVVVSRCHRLNGVQGGALIACRKCKSFNLLHSYNFRDLSCSIVIKVNQTFFGLMVVYNPPLSSDYRVESSTLKTIMMRCSNTSVAARPTQLCLLF